TILHFESFCPVRSIRSFIEELQPVVGAGIQVETLNEEPVISRTSWNRKIIQVANHVSRRNVSVTASARKCCPTAAGNIRIGSAVSIHILHACTGWESCGRSCCFKILEVWNVNRIAKCRRSCQYVCTIVNTRNAHSSYMEIVSSASSKTIHCDWRRCPKNDCTTACCVISTRSETGRTIFY